mmetsp:Transcript_27280/g.84543  ORF Transcript_27280/g.84543 Transcript_27280/m.84543 type:complete len:270 (+) Transcript_27280:276-1085(+)
MPPKELDERARVDRGSELLHREPDPFEHLGRELRVLRLVRHRGDQADDELRADLLGDRGEEVRDDGARLGLGEASDEALDGDEGGPRGEPLGGLHEHQQGPRIGVDHLEHALLPPGRLPQHADEARGAHTRGLRRHLHRRVGDGRGGVGANAPLLGVEVANRVGDGGVDRREVLDEDAGAVVGGDERGGEEVFVEDGGGGARPSGSGGRCSSLGRHTDERLAPSHGRHARTRRLRVGACRRGPCGRRACGGGRGGAADGAARLRQHRGV